MNRRSVLATMALPILAKQISSSTPASTPASTATSTPASTPVIDPWDFDVSGFEFHELDTSTLIFNRPVLVRVRTGETVDDDGIPIMLGEDGVVHNNPVTQAQYLLRMLSNYNISSDQKYLDLAIAIGTRLYDSRHEIDGAYFAPYTFDHRASGDPPANFEAPWYSGMAQGQVLQSYVRLWHATGDDAWMNRADRTAASFLKINDDSRPLIMRTNGRKELWIEEYPDSSYLETLNGHMFAYLGLYEYWLITKDSDVEHLLDGVFTTVLNTVNEYFRNPGQPSHYCMNQPSQPDGYHVVHTAQLLESYRITHDTRFAELAIKLHIDYPPMDVSGDIELPVGLYQVFSEERLKPHLVLGKSYILAVDAMTTIRVHQRRRSWDGDTFYYRFADENGNPVWIPETEPVRLTGELSGALHDHGPLFGTRMAFNPPLTLAVSPELGEQSVSAIALVDGQYRCILEGSDEWVALDIT